MYQSNNRNLLLTLPEFVKQRDYWTRKLSGGIGETAVRFDNRKQQDIQGERLSVDIPFSGDISSRLIKLGKGADISIYVVLAAAVNLLIHKYSASEDIAVWSPLYQPNISDQTLNDRVLLYLPLNSRMTFKDLLVGVKESVVNAYENQDYPFDKIVSSLFGNKENTVNWGLLSDISCIYDNIHHEENSQAIQTPLAFVFSRNDSEIQGKILYDPGVYDSFYASQMARHIAALLHHAMQDIQKPIASIQYLSIDELDQLKNQFNPAPQDYPHQKTFIRLFEEQVARTPENIAAVFGKQQYTYSQLSQKINSLARLLREKGVTVNQLVGIMIEPSMEMVVGIMGILKAGGAFTPIESEHPIHRKEYMLKDSSARLLLTRRELAQGLQFDGEAVLLDDGETYSRDGGPLENIASPSDYLYMIYTSGTTGRPKGVVIDNRNLVNYIHWFIHDARVTHDDRAILTSSYAYDAIYTQFFSSLLTGGQLHVIPRETFLFAERLIKYVRQHNITYIKVTPSLFKIVIDSSDFNADLCGRLRFIMIGGEQMNLADVEKVHKIAPELRIMNHYGPTETTIGSVAHFLDFSRLQNYKQNLSIGKPIHNTDVYVLDKDFNPVPTGVTGELCIGGHSVGLGYLNKPQLTAEKFITPNSKFIIQNSKLYSTGDLARWLPGGEIEILGRIDHQVKIGGNRIELGEIENHILKQNHVDDSVVIVKGKETGEKYLCAYFVAKEKIDPLKLKDNLASDLPYYMVPSYFIQLDRIPLTKHNKLDRHALPEPQKLVGIQKNYVPPANDTEKTIVKIWAEVLGAEEKEIGVEDNFFELGGNSIKIILAANRITQTFKLDVPMTSFFLHPTIRGLAEDIFREDSVLGRLESIVRLNNCNARKNLFMIHQGEGQIYPYKKLAKLIEKDYNVYGIQAKGLFRESALPKNPEELFGHYIHEMKTVQPEGPYIIAGYCIGTLIAYQMVSILEEQGDTVEGLMIFNQPPLLTKTEVKKLQAKEFIGGKLKKGKNTTSHSTLLEPDVQAPQVATDALESRHQTVQTNIGKIFRKIKIHRIIQSPLLVLRAQDGRSLLITQRNWDILSKGNVKVFEVPGDHNTIFNIPFVNKIALVFKRKKLFP